MLQAVFGIQENFWDLCLGPEDSGSQHVALSLQQCDLLTLGPRLWLQRFRMWRPAFCVSGPFHGGKLCFVSWVYLTWYEIWFWVPDGRRWRGRKSGLAGRKGQARCVSWRSVSSVWYTGAAIREVRFRALTVLLWPPRPGLFRARFFQ